MIGFGVVCQARKLGLSSHGGSRVSNEHFVEGWDSVPIVWVRFHSLSETASSPSVLIK